MKSLRASVATLPRFAPNQGLNLSEVAEFVHMERPVSLKSLVAKIDSLPASVPFHSTIKTGTALGGEVTITLNRDGSYRFQGFMRATGIPSFKFRISAVVRSASKQVMVAAQKSGTVFGTDTPGNRQFNWDEVSNNLQRMQLVRNVWPDISDGTLVVNRSSELSGVLGTAADIAKDVAQFFVAAQTLGAGLAICLVIGSELGDAGVSVPGLGGVVGLGIVGGSLFIWGPLAIGPAIILGVAAGAVVDSMITIRRMRDDEIKFAQVVFGDSIDFERVRLTNLLGLGNRPFTLPTVDNTILVNIGPAIGAPTTNNFFKNYPEPGQLFIHELTHVWQVQHTNLKDGYVPGWLCRGITDSSYKPGPPGPAWSSFGVEAQASIVDQWFGGNKGARKATDGTPEAIPKNEDSEYFRYIRDNIRLGES